MAPPNRTGLTTFPYACPLAHQEPYAHFSWNFRDVIGNNPTYTCTIAHISYRYDYYTGDDNYYVHQQNSNYYYRNEDTNKCAVAAWVHVCMACSVCVAL
jgi:hypothetical protein